MHELLTTDALAILVVSFGVGIVVGLTGMGGGALMTPALIFLGVSPTMAVTNDLVAAAVNRPVGALVHLRRGSPNLKLVMWLVIGSVPTAFLGAFLIKALGTTDQQESFLRNAIGAALLFTAVTYAFRMYMQMRYLTGGNVIKFDEVTVKPIPTLLIGLVGGLLVGVTSVGAGSLMMVSLLLLYPTLSAVKLVGTDLMQAVPARRGCRRRPRDRRRSRLGRAHPAHRRRHARHLPRGPDRALGLPVGHPTGHRRRCSA